MKGLTTSEAAARLKEFGLNVITSQKRKNLFNKFWELLADFFSLLLLAAAVISLIFGHTLDGVLIIAVVLLNLLFGLYQEKKAEEAIKLLVKFSATKTRVIRDGHEQEIESSFLVPGDFVVVDEGSKLPADGEIFETKHFEVNESALTGESFPITKTKGDKVFMGTIVAKGRATVRIQTTGMNTEFGKITARLAEVEETKSPLQKKLANLSKVIGIIGILMSAGVFGLSVLVGMPQYLAFLLAVSLAVAIVPEGLPAVMTMTLAIGVREMTKKKAIVRQLSSIEAIGNITLIATDKTGTITSNQMDIDQIYVDGKIYTNKNLPEKSNHPFNKLILDGILCSTASLVKIKDHGKFDVLGDPTEGSILLTAQKKGYEIQKIREEWKVLDESAFDSEKKRMAVNVKRNNELYTFVKGSPEALLKLSNSIQIGEQKELLTEKRKKEIEGILAKWAKHGYRLLAFGVKEDEEKGMISFSPMYTFLGIVAIHDPIRPEVTEAIQKAKKAGIEVVMITGDNEKTAEAIGKQAGLLVEGDEILLGEQIGQYSDDELMKLLPRVRIFARTTPFDKDRIVSLYQKLGHVVAVTGDGVNDAIALKRADVGIAMGQEGTDVARETADMVLADDNFATIVNAIEEGRSIIKKLKNATTYLFSTNFSEVLALTIGLAIGIPSIFTAIQILFINLIGDGMPSLALAFSPKDEDIMNKPPEKEIEIVDKYDKIFIIGVGATAAGLVLAGYFLLKGNSEIEGKTIAFAILAMIQSFVLIDLWVSHKSIRKGLRSLFSPVFLVAFLLPIFSMFIIVHVPFLTKVFEISTLSTVQFLQALGISSLVLLGIKIVKIFSRKEQIV